MNAWSVDLLPVARTNEACAACGHPEWAHVQEDVPRAIERPTLCTECDDWHEFTPAQEA